MAIAIGNSNCKFGVFQGGEIVARWRVHTEPDKTADEYAVMLEDFLAHAGLDGAWDGAIIVSVVPALTLTMQELASKYLQVPPMVVGAGLKTGMPVR